MLVISTDKKRIDLKKLIRFLIDESYWAKSRTKDQILRSVKNSMCFGMYEDDKMIGFARVVTDYGVYAYLADVFIDKEHRGNGFGKILMDEVLNHPELQMVSRWMLGTVDAHELYRPYGFSEVKDPKRWMEYLPKGSELS